MTVHIDTLSLTGNLKSDEYEASCSDSEGWCYRRFTSLIPRLAGMVTTGKCLSGVNGYLSGYSIELDGAPIGHVAVGGNCNKMDENGYQVYINGVGCTAIHCFDDDSIRKPLTWETEVSSWSYLAYAAESMDMRITRLDIAADFFKGEFNVDDAANMYLSGGFDSWNNQRPMCNQMGDWLTKKDTKGRTFYVGSRQYSVKYLRVYEKGKQLGSPDSPWVRWEVEFKRQKGYNLTFDMIRNPSQYWKGAYQGFSDMIDSTGEKLQFVKESVKVSFNHLIHWFRQGYGRVLRVAEAEGMSLAQILDGVPYELPRRMRVHVSGLILHPVSNTGGVNEAAAF